jgi:hypothetical protein
LEPGTQYRKEDSIILDSVHMHPEVKTRSFPGSTESSDDQLHNPVLVTIPILTKEWGTAAKQSKVLTLRVHSNSSGHHPSISKGTRCWAVIESEKLL